MLKIKLTRTGKRNQPSFRIVVQEDRERRDGAVVEILGHYQPLQQPHLVQLDKKRYRYWLSKGAQPTKTVSTLVKRA